MKITDLKKQVILLSTLLRGIIFDDKKIIKVHLIRILKLVSTELQNSLN